MKLHEGSLKLAGLYLTILMIISVFFSATLYRTSMMELDRGLRRPTPAIENLVGLGYSNGIRQQILDERLDRYDDAQERLIRELIIINLFILVGGGALSYYLALRTLKPIEEAHESQSRFTADASHELRTPITTMRTENEVALMEPKLTLKQAKEQLKSNVEELEKLSDLSEGLLRLAQIDNNHLQKAAVSSKSIAHTAIERALPRAEQRRILIKSNIKTDALVEADEVSLTEALITLIDNAIKYSPDNTEVIVETAQNQRQVIFTITDHGPGIEQSELAYIFDRFYRADSSRTKQHIDGYGLGLAIAKSIADAHKGNITVKSKPGKGSTFALSVPIAHV